MLLENRTSINLVVVDNQEETILEAGEKAYYGDLKKNETLKIISSEGNATISMLEDELFWESTDDDFIKGAIQSDGLLQLEEILICSSRAWSRHLNGICLAICKKD